MCEWRCGSPRAARCSLRSARRSIDEITADTLIEWWERDSKARTWRLEIGFPYLATIAEVMKQGRARRAAYPRRTSYRMLGVELR